MRDKLTRVKYKLLVLMDVSIANCLVKIVKLLIVSHQDMILVQNHIHLLTKHQVLIDDVIMDTTDPVEIRSLGHQLFFILQDSTLLQDMQVHQV
jgi:hypothetical protein